MHLRFMDSLIRLSLIILVLGFWELGPGSSYSFAQLQGRVTSNQQLDTSDIHVSQLILDIDHEVGIVGNAIRRGPTYEDPVNADFNEFSAELKAGSSPAQQYSPCVHQYKSAYAHYLKAADLMAEYSRTRLTASPATLQSINQQMNGESNTGGNLFNAARQCSQQVEQHPDVFNSNGDTEQTPNVQPLSVPGGKPKEQPACQGGHAGLLDDPWNAWKYRVSNAVALHYQGGKTGLRGLFGGGNNSGYATAEFDVAENGTISNLHVYLASRGQSPDVRGPFQAAVAQLRRDEVLPFPSRSTTVHLEVIRDKSGCFQPGAYYQTVDRSRSPAGNPGVSAQTAQNTRPTQDSGCPKDLVVTATLDQYEKFDRGWFSKGGQTGGGIVAVMSALPASKNWVGTHMVESVEAGSTTCNFRNRNVERVKQICGTDAHNDFVVGTGSDYKVNENLTFSWYELTPLKGDFPFKHSFADFHLAFDKSNKGTPIPSNLLDGTSDPRSYGPAFKPQDSCTITCKQIYTCGDKHTYGPIIYGRFLITFAFSRGSRGITRATVTKRKMSP